MQSFNKHHIIISITFTILFILSILFYKERTIFADLSFHIFELIRTNKYAIQNYRFGSIFTQTLPLMAIKLKMPLKVVMLIYSSSFIIYYFALYLICVKVFKQFKYALLLFLMLVFAVVHTFYWIQSEFPQGIAFMIFSFAFIENMEGYKTYSWKSFLACGLLVTVAFFHPSLIFPFTFFIGFKLIIENNNHRKKWIIAFSIYSAILIIKTIFFRTIYDRWALGGLKNFYYKFPDYINLQSNIDFLSYLAHDYYLLFFGIIALGIYYFPKKEYKLILLIGFYFFGYLILTNISYADGTNQFYIENLYLPLSFFLLVPLVFHVWQSNSSKKIVFYVFVFLVSIRLCGIYKGHEKYTERLNWSKELLEKTSSLENNKLIISENDVPMDTVMIAWGSSYEFWLLSTINGNPTRSVVIHENPESLSWARNKTKGFLTNWGVYEYEALPQIYFNFVDTTSHYVFFSR